jgi:sulfur carrier protein ThiS
MAMDVPAGTTVAAFLASLGADRDTWLVAVNRTAVDRDRVLEPGDELDCFEPVAAG